MVKKAKKKTRPKGPLKNKKTQSKRGWNTPLALILVATFIAFTPMLSADFLNYDDDYYITNNPYIINFNLANLKYLFTNIFGNQYAPIAMSIMGIEFTLFGANPFFLKLISILLHLLCTFLVFEVTKLLFKKPTYAIITAAIFALHPLQVEAVAWLTASMKIGTYTAFFLASLLYYLKYLDKGFRSHYLLSCFFFLLSCLCKEQAIALLAILPLIDYVRNRKLLSQPVLLEKIPYLFIAVGFAIVTLSIKNDMQSADMVQYFSPANRILFSTVSFATYLFHFLIPAGLSTFYTPPPRNDIPVYFYLAPIVFVVYLALTIRAWKKNDRTLVFISVFFIANLFLTFLSQALSVRDVMMADRYVYIPMISLGLLVAYLTEQLVDRKKLSSKGLQTSLITLSVILGLLSFGRTQVWKDSIAVFTDAIEQGTWEGSINPSLALPYTNRGALRRTNGDVNGALEDYNKALEANPKFATAYLNRGNAYFILAKYDLAAPDYQKALELDPDNPKIYSSRGALYGTQNRNDLALADFNKAIELDPNYQDPLKNRIRLYVASNQRDLALAEIERYLAKFPGDAEIIGYQNTLQGN